MLKLGNKLEKAGLKVVKFLQDKSFKAFFVGGFVRNRLLKLESDNLDIATDALPDDVEKILNKARIKTKAVGKKFGTILAIVDDSFPIEITTFRKESRYSDNRHPDQVQFIKDYLNDAKRRDFTVNALYYEPIKRQTFDPTGGIKDLGLKLLRFVGDPKKRIDEDGLRMLRGVRLATQIGFKLEKNSFAAIKTRAKYIQKVSGERIKAELDKILSSPNRLEGIRLLDQTGLLRFIIPEMEPLKKFFHKSKLYHLEGNMFDHTLLVLSKPKNPDIDLAYAILFHDIGKPFVAEPKIKAEGRIIATYGHAEVSAQIFRQFAGRLHFPKKQEKKIEWAIANHMVIPKFDQMRPEKQVKYLVRPDFAFLLDLAIADDLGNVRAPGLGPNHKPGWRHAKIIFSKYQKLLSRINRLAKGNLIMKQIKLKPGRELGSKINKIKAEIISGQIKSKIDLKNYLRKNT